RVGGRWLAGVVYGQLPSLCNQRTQRAPISPGARSLLSTPDRAPPRAAWLQAAPAGWDGTRGGTPAPRVPRGWRRGMLGRARPAGGGGKGGFNSSPPPADAPPRGAGGALPGGRPGPPARALAGGPTPATP